MSISAMKQALEALDAYSWEQVDAARAALRQAIEQAEKTVPSDYSNSHQQEPVIGTKTWFEDGKMVTQHLYASDISQERVDETAKDRHELAGTIPISNGGIATSTPTDFFAPPKREWVGLSDKEVKKIVDKNTSDIWCNGKGVARDVEAKLKEKNT